MRSGGISAIARQLVLFPLLCLSPGVLARPPELIEAHLPEHALRGGSATFVFDRSALEGLGWTLVARGASEPAPEATEFSFEFHPTSTLQISSAVDGFRELVGGRLRVDGTLLFLSSGRRFAVTNLTLSAGSEKPWAVYAASGYGVIRQKAFGFSSLVIDLPAGSDTLRMFGELSVSEALAHALGDPAAAGVTIGTLVVDTVVDWQGGPQAAGTQVIDDGEFGQAFEAGTIGPDVIVGDLQGIVGFGSASGITAFAIGTVSCNVGDEPLSWFANTNQHPVISQGMYRLKEGRFEQIGLAWVKHGFAVVAGDACSLGCIEPPGGSQQLGIGCSDPYTASLNGSRNNMSPRSGINAFTGYFEVPWEPPPGSNTTIGRRLQVSNTDLNPDLNVGASYFIEGHYVTPDDAAAGNQTNNASHRAITISGELGVYEAALAGFTLRQQPAIRAWKNADPSVKLTGVTIPSDGVLWIGSKATDLGNGQWHYEYAVHNLSSHRSARSFRVPLPDGVTAQNIGFHDVDYHSGDPQDATDWISSVGDNEVNWTTEAYSINPDANALRWGTIYNFRFDANSEPQNGVVTIGLFRPGSPASTMPSAFVPGAPVAVCGDGFIGEGEACDPPDGVNCDGFCQWICGDGVVQEGEECDPPDGIDCDSECRIIYICGDEVVDPGEECDPPNGLTCDNDCLRIAICGDAIVDPGEDCDPPNGITCDVGCARISNDACLSAVFLCPGVFDATNLDSTNDGDTSCADIPGNPDVWFSYTPLIDGTLTVDTCGSTLDTVLSIHTDCAGGAGSELACNDDACGSQSSVSVPVLAGEVYLIRVAGWGGAVGPFRLTVSGPPCLTGPPINDECVFTFPVGEGTTPLTTLQGATDGPQEATACNDTGSTQIDADIWYCYRPSCTGTATVRLCDTDFDEMLAVYNGCTCPSEAAALSCSDNSCVLDEGGGSSALSLSVVAGNGYLIRVGGKNGASGTGSLEITCVGPGDGLRGGRLWDNWWRTNGADEPSTDHPLYPPAGDQTGSTTHRCKECHGWDYKGVEGVYGSGPHFTGIGGVFGSTMNPTEMFDLIRGETAPSGHGFENLGLTHQDIWDLVEFTQTLTLDTDLFIDAEGFFLGDPVQGETNYTLGGGLPCILCHGVEGTVIDLGSSGTPQWVGTRAFYHPWEFLHVTRFGVPGQPMPSWLADGGSDQGAVDIGRYAQLSFPVDCTVLGHCDDGAFCSGAEDCVDGFCIIGVDPCPGSVCDEDLMGCLSGLCEAPSVVAEGSRYLAITLAPGMEPVALRLTGDPNDGAVSCMTLYVQPDGTIGVDPVFLTPDEWGTVHVADGPIRPSTLYSVRADCGTAGSPDLSFAVTATTWRYGDVDHDGSAGFLDILLQVFGFKEQFDEAALEAMDIDPCVPDRAVGFLDMLEGVQAFKDRNFLCEAPCA